MCIGPEINFYIDDTPLENVSRFKYLGSFISRLKHCVFNNHDLDIETKIKVYKQNLLLVLCMRVKLGRSMHTKSGNCVLSSNDTSELF